MSKNFIDTTTHDFKTHFSEYVRLVSEVPDCTIIIKKYNKPIGMFTAFDDQFAQEIKAMLEKG